MLYKKYSAKITLHNPPWDVIRGCVRQKPPLYRYGLLILAATWTLHGCMTAPQKPTVSEPTGDTQSAHSKETAAQASGDLMGDWCYVKKRRVTMYTVKQGKLHIRSGRSGRLYEADLTCNQAYTECQAKTIRGWETPVTETLRLDREKMNLTRVWGGAWKDKTYNFTYTRCPKW